MQILNIMIVLAAWIPAIYTTSISTPNCTYCVEETSVAYDPNNPGSVPDSTCQYAYSGVYTDIQTTMDQLAAMISRGVCPKNIMITTKYAEEYVAGARQRFLMNTQMQLIDLFCVDYLPTLIFERIQKLSKTRNILSEKLTFGYIRNQVSSLKDSYDDTKYSDIGIIYNDEPRTTIETINYEGELNMNRYDQLYHPLSGVISKYLGPVKVPSREYPKKKGRYHRSCWDSITSCYKSLCCCYTSCN
eukprot:116588_1